MVRDLSGNATYQALKKEWQIGVMIASNDYYPHDQQVPATVKSL
jgi:hypothetical protein